MSSRADKGVRAKALDLWTAPQGAGEALVCIATSFTFDATFFETECIGRFLQMDNHPSEDESGESVAYLVEREEKLAAAKVCALVDRRHARDKESLRWDIIGVLVPRAVQHSKVALLVWGNHARVIIGSGNLTEPGYRKNLEVFGTIELSRKDGGDRDAVLRTIDFLTEVVKLGVGDDAENTPKQRTREALTLARKRIAHWTSNETSGGPTPVFGIPGRGVLPQLLERWPSNQPPRWAYIVSPFFDIAGKATDTVDALIRGMAERGNRDIIFYVRSESLPDGTRRLFAPRDMVSRAEERCHVEVRVVSAIQDGELQPLHAKMLTLENEHWCLLLTGSSNFTAAGLTAATGGSFEANLLYRLKADDDRRVEDLWPEIDDEVFDSTSKKVVWDPEPEECEGRIGDVPLPGAFREAIFSPGSAPTLLVHLESGLPSEWSIRVPKGAELLSSLATGPGRHELAWKDESPPFVLEVSWQSESGPLAAFWPVNVSNPSALPPPEALQGLTLEELLAILASTRPLPQAVVAVLKKRVRNKARVEEILDPLKRLDSPAFLLRRTKRVAAALDRMRERLERPALSKDALEWRVNGPVGPTALARAFVQEARLPGEAKFYMAELALAVKRVVPQRTAEGGLSVDIVQESLAKAIASIKARTNELPSTAETTQLDGYVAAAFREASLR